MPKKYEFKVAMTCEGCSGAVKRVLGKLQGIDNVTTDVETKTVVVETDLPSDQILETLKKTNLEVSFVGES